MVTGWVGNMGKPYIMAAVERGKCEEPEKLSTIQRGLSI
jgi:hypothetical protein